MEAGLITFPNTYFEFGGEVLEESQYGSLVNLSNAFASLLHGLSKAFLWGSARRRLLAAPLCCRAALISASTRGLAHQRCAPPGRLERGVNSAGVKSMTSAMSVAMSLTQLLSKTGGLLSFLSLSLFLRFGADLHGM